ncbi:single-stranded DNA-binding protein [Arthrobacter woluwensis]|uniref:Single-stranded DNA-binding protein n=1 Tax=Arthrobacter woluwensis TaxID=156980 RepID=A0A1H4I7K2_9MICC|nr:single-stranded DNA-binding protein [Arthrobacter woluwensis]SEB30059.1 single-strand DNA-binding protein [Arthrobacter woluwensis]
MSTTNAFRNVPVTGNLTKEPAQITTKNGPMVTFRLAVSDRFFDREANEWKSSPTEYYDIGVRNKALQENIMASKLQTGDRLTVVGRYEARPYVTKDGEAALNNRLWAETAATSMDFRTVSVSPKQSGPGAEQETGVSSAQVQSQAQTQTYTQADRALDDAWGINH